MVSCASEETFVFPVWCLMCANEKIAVLLKGTCHDNKKVKKKKKFKKRTQQTFNLVSIKNVQPIQQIESSLLSFYNIVTDQPKVM